MGLFTKQNFRIKEDLVYVKDGVNGCECYEKSFYPQFKAKTSMFGSKWLYFKDKSGVSLKFAKKDDAWNYLQLNYLPR